MQLAQGNDLVILVDRERRRYLVRLQVGQVFHSHQGRIPHEQIIGGPFGRTVRTLTGQPFLVLEPSTADLIQEIKRNSQIVYPKDAAYLLMRLNAISGARILECGTGSGGLTLALARAVAPGGHVYSYDIRTDMSNLARNNMESLGLDSYVTFAVRDALSGFDETDVDSVMLDLRAPWLILDQVEAALKPGGFLAALVPTVNQVAALINGLQQHGYLDIEVEELLIRPWKIAPARLRPEDRMIAHTGFLLFARRVLPGDESLLWNKQESRRARIKAALGTINEHDAILLPEDPDISPSAEG